MPAKELLDRLARLRPWQVVLAGLAAAAVFELATVLFRFGLGMESTRDTSMLAPLTLGFRIHHGYVGLVLLAVAWFVRRHAGIRNALVIVGLTLVVSDLVHHFLVLWPITGSPEFDLRYGG